ncbi:MAG: hypothetical protein FWE17_01435 [Alphaproteobacteria bacterium]|nr:hypothetical protein [Alphaproteobacteria bacterium]MCL2757947.1 hypothetical protein [Alphaproteobacteria bacterium]
MLKSLVSRLVTTEHDGMFFRKHKVFGISFRTIRRHKVKQMNRHSEYLLSNTNSCYKVFSSFRKKGIEINWEAPKIFAEKLLWLQKYYFRRMRAVIKPIEDKESFKKWATKKGLGEYVPKLLGAYNRPEDIDWDGLPERFVLKATSGCAGRQVMIVPDKSKTKRKDAIRKMNKWRNIRGRPERFIVEEMLSDCGDGLTDYKFFCLNGRVEFILSYARAGTSVNVADKTMAAFDKRWGKLPCIVHVDKYIPYGDIPKPKNLDEMVRLAEKISAEFPFVRVDMYNVDGRIYIGELTFSPSAGLMSFEPAEYNTIYGDKLKLPEKLPPISD